MIKTHSHPILWNRKFSQAGFRGSHMTLWQSSCKDASSREVFPPFLFKILFIYFRERGREGEREGEKYRCARETLIDGLPHACPQPGTWPATQVCTLTRNGISELSVCGMMPNSCITSQGPPFLDTVKREPGHRLNEAQAMYVSRMYLGSISNLWPLRSQAYVTRLFIKSLRIQTYHKHEARIPSQPQMPFLALLHREMRSNILEGWQFLLISQWWIPLWRLPRNKTSLKGKTNRVGTPEEFYHLNLRFLSLISRGCFSDIDVKVGLLFNWVQK